MTHHGGVQASYLCADHVHTEDPQGQQLEAEAWREFVRGLLQPLGAVVREFRRFPISRDH